MTAAIAEVEPMRQHFKATAIIALVLAGGLVAKGALAATDTGAIPAATEQELRTLYKKLIDAENAHDIDAVGRFVWKSPSALFVAKTKTPAEGNWAGFWGAENVIAHLGELYRGTFVMTPDYGREKVVLLSQDVAQTYVPLQISVGYAGQSGTPRPFLMIVEWVKDQGAWKMTTDIALPIPSASPQ
jgi:hypothetical protein